MSEKEKPKKKPNNCIVVNFTISDCPLWLYKWFNDDPKRYNDIYWVRLKELHDAFMFLNMQPKEEETKLTPDDPEMEKKAKEYVVNTFRGKETMKMDEEEKEK